MTKKIKKTEVEMPNCRLTLKRKKEMEMEKRDTKKCFDECGKKVEIYFTFDMHCALSDNDTYTA